MRELALLQEQEAGYLDLVCSDGLPSAQWKLMIMREGSCLSASETENSNGSQFGTTLAPSTDLSSEAQSTLSQEGSLAKTLAPQGRKSDCQERARAYGKKCCESLAKFNLTLSLPRTHKCFVLADCKASSKDLPTWGIMQDGVCLEVGMSARRIGETECGSLLPTPTCVGNELCPSMQKWKGHQNLVEFLGRTGGPILALREWMMGVADRMDRVRATGNGQIPLVAALAWNVLGEDGDLVAKHKNA